MASQASSGNATRRGGRTAGAEGYTSADVKALLRCIHTVKPIGGSDWERVLTLYQDTYASPNDRALRSTTSIKTKFNGLISNAKKTGNPHCPQEIKDAKAIQRLIEEKTHLLRINDNDDEPRDCDELDEHDDAPSGNSCVMPAAGGVEGGVDDAAVGGNAFCRSSSVATDTGKLRPSRKRNPPWSMGCRRLIMLA